MPKNPVGKTGPAARKARATPAGRAAAAAKNPKFGSSDIAPPKGTPAGSSYGRDLSESNRKYFAGSTKRAATRANVQAGNKKKSR